MQELYALPADILPAVQQYLPRFDMVLDDLSRQTDEELRSKAQAGLGLLALVLLRWSRNGTELLERFTVWTDVWRAVCEAPDQQQALFMALRYVALATEPATMQDLIRKLEPILGESAREVIMTFGEQLIEEGRQKGLAEGRAEGEAAGRVQAQADALLRLLALRKLPVSDELRARIETCSDLSTLVRWFDRAATAQSASEAISEA
jgi:hypothetical protein